MKSKRNFTSSEDALQNEVSNASSSRVEPVMIHDPSIFFIDLRFVENDNSTDEYNEEQNQDEDMIIDEESESEEDDMDTIQTKAGHAQYTTTTTGRDTPLAYRKSGWLSPQPGKGNQLLAGIILVSCFVTFVEAREIASNKETFKSCWLLVLFIILMAVGGSGNGSLLGRVTGNRGRGGKGRNDTRGLGQGRGNGEVDPEEENDAQGSDEQHEDDDAGQSDGVLTFGRAQRSICDGDYKKKPQLGQPKLGVVTFINGKNIKEARYKKTIRAIVRNNREFEIAKEKGRAREPFLNKCIQEFKEYYEYQPEYKVDKIKELEGDAVVRNHLKANLKCYMNAWKTDADNRVKEAHARGDTSATRRTYPLLLIRTCMGGFM
ncbi:hypothetical protein AgCh_023416 [Apium graveolens]